MKKSRKAKEKLTARKIDAMHDAGVDLSKYVDWSTATPLNEVRRVNVDFPNWMVTQLDREAQRLGVPRQSIIKVWIAERLAESAKKIA